MELEFGGYLCLNIFNNLRYPQSEMYPQLIKRQNWHRVSLAQVCLSNSHANLPSLESTDFQSRQSQQLHPRDPANPQNSRKIIEFCLRDSQAISQNLSVCLSTCMYPPTHPLILVSQILHFM